MHSRRIKYLQNALIVFHSFPLNPLQCMHKAIISFFPFTSPKLLSC